MGMPSASTTYARLPSVEVDWEKVLDQEIQKPYFKALAQFVKDSRKTNAVYPPLDDMFRAFELTPFNRIKVVIVGQDPYHGEGEADGLAFSTKLKAIPPSLRNIYKETNDDLQISLDTSSGDLSGWASQGVFLINSILTVNKDAPGSHANRGWETFTTHVLKEISDRTTGTVFILWGKFAQAKKHLIDKTRHCILEAPHPSPLSAHKGFFGCKHFSQTNKYLESINKTAIVWDKK